MPRSARRQCESGTYHVMLRGINREPIFHDDEDYLRFLDTLRRYRAECGFQLYAYSLMPNHVHLLIREGDVKLSGVFRRIGASYVYWYNGKYDRVGHLFQDRFRSEAVDSDEYLLTVLRYIHWNPVRAGLCASLRAYPYSSFRGYFEPWEMVDSALIGDMLGRDGFVQFNEQENDDHCLDLEVGTNRRLTDRQALEQMQSYNGCANAEAFHAMDIEKQEQTLRFMAGQGISIRQMCRILGVSYRQARRFTR